MTNEIITTEGVLLDAQGIRRNDEITVTVAGDALIVGGTPHALDDIRMDRGTKCITGPGGWEIAW